MQSTFFKLAILITFSSTWAFDFESIPFEPGKAADEANASKQILDEAASALKSFPKMEISIAGHTDTSECAGNSCFELSRRRARFVADWLVAHAVDRARINGVTGMGSGYAVDKNDTEQGRAHNRRVEIFPIEPDNATP